MGAPLYTVGMLQPVAPVNRVKELFGLTSGEVAYVFGATHPEVVRWEHGGHIPSAAGDAMGDLLAVGEILEHKLQPGLLPLVARRVARAYGGFTLLEMVANGRSQVARELTERAFDWSGTGPGGEGSSSHGTPGSHEGVQ